MAQMGCKTLPTSCLGARGREIDRWDGMEGEEEVVLDWALDWCQVHDLSKKLFQTRGCAQSTPTFRTWTWGRDSLSTSSSSSSCFLTNISFMFVVVAVAAACKWNFCQFSLFAWDREGWWGGGLEGDGTQQTTLKVTSEPFNLSWHSQQILLPVCGMKIFFYFFFFFIFSV